MGRILNNISPSNIFLIVLLSERYLQKHQAALAATGIKPLALRAAKTGLTILLIFSSQ